MTRRRRGLPLGSVVLIAGSLVTTCGTASTTSGAAPWRAGHPDQPQGCDTSRSLSEAGHCTVEFQDATGLCAVSVQFPDDAPGVVVVEGTVFVQRGKSQAAPEAAGAHRLAASGDWILDEVSGAELSLLTPQAVFDYRSGAPC